MVDIRNAPRFSAALVGVALASVLIVGTGRAADAPAIPVNVPVPVELTTPITSQTAHVGDPFLFKTTKDEKLGDLEVPAGTPGAGRLAMVEAAHDKHNGSVTLQADKLQLTTSGAIVWVNIDPGKPPTGHYSDKKTRFYLLPLPIGVVPGTFQSVSGNMILDAGTAFRVVTILPRTEPAPLVTATPSPTPSMAPMPAPSPAASAT
ncbi:MAG: hypothetical protein IAI50_02885 [Candidatus Eremiobacteraeota bacterium]|nr:hypothetical protein [Candidatus Eremiobacteraeota bacterium]